MYSATYDDYDLPSLQQTCGSQGQEDWGNWEATDRFEANADAQDCSPWMMTNDGWSITDAMVVKNQMQRPLKSVNSSIEMKAGGSYPFRGGYYMQPPTGDTVSDFMEGHELVIADAAQAGLAAGAALIAAALSF